MSRLPVTLDHEQLESIATGAAEGDFLDLEQLCNDAQAGDDDANALVRWWLDQHPDLAQRWLGAYRPHRTRHPHQQRQLAGIALVGCRGGSVHQGDRGT